MMKQAQIATHMKNLRNALRTRIEVITSNYPFARAVTDYLCISPDQVNNLNFYPTTVVRLNVLMDVPAGSLRPNTTQYIKAVQNFINRRQDPWAFFRQLLTENQGNSGEARATLGTANENGVSQAQITSSDHQDISDVQDISEAGIPNVVYGE